MLSAALFIPSTFFYLKKVPYLKLCYLAPNKALFFSAEQYWYSFLFLSQKLCCGYLLEVALLMSTHNIRFRGEIRKKYTWQPLLSRARYTSDMMTSMPGKSNWYCRKYLTHLFSHISLSTSCYSVKHPCSIQQLRYQDNSIIAPDKTNSQINFVLISSWTYRLWVLIRST